jgi:CelD/BcsL family acetyltransferase involved in cellulose biosynthesis
MLQSRVADGPDWAESLGPAWSELCGNCSSATPFQTFEWQSLWFRHFGGSKRPHIWTAWEGDDLVGLMPFTKSFGPWRALRPMGCGASDYLHPIALPGREVKVAELLSRDLAKERAVHLVDLHQVRETEPLAKELSASTPGMKLLEQAVCLVLDLPASYDEYLGSLGKSLRYDVKRLDKFAAEGRVRICDVEPSNAESAMKTFFDFHGKRWRNRGLPGAFATSRAKRFHLEWAKVASEKGILRMSLLSVNENLAGVIYAMAFGDCAYFYQSGFDPAQKSVSPGTLLVAHAIRNAIREGKKRFDFLRGDEPYKRRWMPQHAYRNLRFLAPSSGLLGKAGGAWNRLGFQIECRLRARLEGRGLL